MSSARILRVPVTTICAAVGAVLLLSSTGIAAAAPAPGALLWSSSYNGTFNSDDRAFSAAVSPDGKTVFVTGRSNNRGDNYTTIAYNAATGAQQWASVYDDNGGEAVAVAVAVSPSGNVVYVTGTSDNGDSDGDYATVAYDAATGAQLWVSRYNGTGNGDDHATALAVSPAGTTVFVTGYSQGPAGDDDYVTIAYNAATGARRWSGRYDGTRRLMDTAHSIAVSPNGTAVYVTGGSDGRHSGVDYATVAYNAATGARLWVRRYNFANRTDAARQVTVSPNGKTVFVTGYSQGARSGNDYATVAYNAATGAQRWVSRYNDRSNGSDIASSVAVSPGGGTVFVTGTSLGTSTGLDFATLAYASATGKQLWVSRHDSAQHCDDFGSAVAASPGGKTVFVSGYSTGPGFKACPSGYAVVAYNAVTGAQQWISPAGPPQSIAYSLAVSPAGNAVYIAGTVNGGIGRNFDMLAAAFRN